MFLAACGVVHAADPLYPLKASSDGRHLEDQAGMPFFINGDTPWSLIVELTKSEAEQYLEDRRARGFNAVIVELIEHEFGGPANRDGELPFVPLSDFTQPNEAYFQHADWVIAKAAEKGLLVILTPAYLGIGCGSQGWCQEMLANSAADLRTYGNFLGNRYKDFDNIIWMHGGDDSAANYGALDELNEIALGIQEADPSKLVTAHCNRGRSAIDCYDEVWLQLNNTYSDCEASAIKTRTDYQRARTLPFFYSEGRYENEGASNGCLRSQAYWSVLGGSVGHFFGNSPIWRFGSGWQSELDSAGANSMTHFRNLFESRHWSLLVPDYAESIVSGDRGNINASSYVMAARASDASTIIAYLPVRRTITVDLSAIDGPDVSAWWYDPSNGQSDPIGAFPANGSRDFTPPNNNDWVLVIDDASLGFGPPGEQPAVPPPPPADTTPPELVRATAVADPNTVVVLFSEPVDTVSSETVANYSIDNAITIVSARLLADQTTVELSTSDLAESVQYTLTVNNVLDRANTPNSIMANSTTGFQFDGGSAGGGPENYEWAVLEVGRSVYIDSTLVFKSVPSAFVNRQYLRTAAADSMASGSPFLSIDLASSSTVYVGYDTRNTVLPGWLQSWGDTGVGLDIGEPSGPVEATLRLYSRDFAAGQAGLGGNEAGNAMYTVAVAPMESPAPLPDGGSRSGGGAIDAATIAYLFLVFAATGYGLLRRQGV